MSGISDPHRQAACSECGRVLTLDGERTTDDAITMACPGRCEGSAVIPSRAQMVADLWHRQNGWIPGADRQNLEDILGIPLDKSNTGKSSGHSISFG